MKHLTSILAVLIVITIGLACSGDERGKANGLVSEANKFVTEANENVKKAEAKGNEYDSMLAKISTDKALNELRDFSKDLMKLYDAMQENFQKAGEKFEEASKLKINDKAKEYLGIKGNEMKKRAEYSAEIKKIPQALIDSKSKQEYVSDAQKYGANAKKMLAEANEMAEKANKLAKENPVEITSPTN